jgi:acyl dehydratase
MPETSYFTPQTVADAVGRTFTSDWLVMDQERISAFGRTTDDLDPAHIDPDWCRDNSPWGTPIAFGFLTISMLTRMVYDVYKYPLDGDAEKEGYPVNYGFDRLRLIEPVHAGERVRGHFTLRDVHERKAGQMLMTLDTSVEIEGRDKPALVAEWLTMWVLPEEGTA